MEKQSDLFLLLSNVCVVPALVYALYIRSFISATILATVSSVSFLYHSCQAGFFCLFESNVSSEAGYYLLQKSDEFFVSIAFTWFVLYAIEIEENFAAAIIFALQGLFLLALISGESYSTTIVYSAIAVAVFILLTIWFIRPIRLRFAILPSLCALVLLTVGVTLFGVAGDPGEQRYWLYHSLWHCFLFVSVFFVLMIKTTGYSLILSPKK